MAPTACAELVVLPAFIGAPARLQRVDQLTDGTHRVMPKAVPNSEALLALSAHPQQHADADQVRRRQSASR